MALYLDQTPATPRWNLDLDVSFDPAVVPCPALVQVIAGGISSDLAKGCGSVLVRMPVFNATHHLQPSSVTTFEVFVNGQATAVSLMVPPAPVWVGAGDGLTAGAHGPASHTVRAAAADPGFSFVARSVATIDKAVPSGASVWDMTAVDVASPGADTRSIVEHQLLPVSQQLSTHRNSWNVISVSGGLDDTRLPGQLDRWYATQCNANDCTPWQPVRHQSCLDWAGVQHDAQSAQVVGQIRNDLATVFDQAVFADPDVRRIQVLEPGLVDRFLDNRPSEGANPCYSAATAVIGALDAIRPGTVVLGLPVQVVDPRAAFGSSDVPTGPPSTDGLIQTTTPVGYPDPGRSGQSQLATLAVEAAGP